MDSEHNFVHHRLTQLENDHLYRRLKVIVVDGTIAFVDGKRKIHLCSNDYLGLSQNRLVLARTILSLKQISQCSSRLIAGNDPSLMELEGDLAKHRGTESALVYPTGYMANLGVITSIAKKGTTIFSDELNHASIIDGCKLSGASIKVFSHNNPDALRELLHTTSGKKIVVTEGVFSMDGDISKLKQICSLARDHNALTLVDDAHGDFIYGQIGFFSGTPSYLKVQDLVDINVSSLSKALGCFGGYVATSKEIRELLINESRQFIYTSSLPTHLCVSAISSIPIASSGHLQRRLFRNIDYISRRLRKLGFLIGKTECQIIPIILGDEVLAINFANDLLANGIFAQPIRYPTVKKGSARLRITVTALHNENHLNSAINCLECVAKKMNII